MKSNKFHFVVIKGTKEKHKSRGYHTKQEAEMQGVVYKNQKPSAEVWIKHNEVLLKEIKNESPTPTN